MDGSKQIKNQKTEIKGWKQLKKNVGNSVKDQTFNSKATKLK